MQIAIMTTAQARAVAWTSTMAYLKKYNSIFSMG